MTNQIKIFLLTLKLTKKFTVASLWIFNEKDRKSVIMQGSIPYNQILLNEILQGKINPYISYSFHPNSSLRNT